MDGKSLDLLSEKISKLKGLFPEAFIEEKIDWEKLQAALGGQINFSSERYHLNWAGKSEVFIVLQQRTSATLLPIKEESIDFNETENVFIEGENLEVLKVLQKSYFSKIKMIYIDPPYNTGNDSFIYPDRFSETKDDYLKRIGDKDEEGFLLKEGMFRKNSKESGHYHSNWLSMIYPRLYLARNLLREDGVIFVSIDDNEVHNLRMIMNEIFGEENFLATFIRRQNLAGRQDAKFISTEQDYVLCYGKNLNVLKINFEIANLDSYDLEDEYVNERGKFYLRRMDDDGMNYSEKLDYPFEIKNGQAILIYNEKTKKCNNVVLKENITIYPGGSKEDRRFNWRWSFEKVKWGIEKDVIVLKKNNADNWQLNFKSYSLVDNNLNKTQRSNPFKTILMNFTNNIAHKGFKELFDNAKYFDYPKPIDLARHLIRIGAEKNDIVLDFFAGSGTTAQAVMELNKEDGGNRKFILVQLPEKTDEKSEAFKAGYKTIADICKERVRRVIKKLILTEEESKIVNKQQQLGLDIGENSIGWAYVNTGKVEFVKEKTAEDRESKLGFKVFKLAPSNFKIWRTDAIENADDLEKMIDIFDDKVKPNAEKENMLYELILKSGYPLTVETAYMPTQEDGYYSINNNETIILLDRIDQAMIEEVLKLNPKNVLSLDKLFSGNDQLKTNTVLQMKDAGIEFRTV